MSFADDRVDDLIAVALDSVPNEGSGAARDDKGLVRGASPAGADRQSPDRRIGLRDRVRIVARRHRSVPRRGAASANASAELDQRITDVRVHDQLPFVACCAWQLQPPFASLRRHMYDCHHIHKQALYLQRFYKGITCGRKGSPSVNFGQ